jgi:hypothetical protein
MKTIKNKNIKNRKSKKTTKKVYSPEHYKSGDGMLTSVWGPSLWHYLHTMSFNYPIKPTMSEKKNYMKFIKSLRHVLPCKYCRINLKENFKQTPITMACMKNRETFSLYIFNLHETINKMLNKKSGLTYEDVRERYEHFRARCKTKKKKLFKFKKTKKHLGCTEPIHKVKSKGVVKIVPQNEKCESLQIDNKCVAMKK